MFQLFGGLLIGLGAYVAIELHKYLDFFEVGVVNGPAIVLIVFGGITLIVAFFGCCGAYKENHCMIMTVSRPIADIVQDYYVVGSISELAGSSVRMYRLVKGVGIPATASW